MANALYSAGKRALMKKDIDLEVDTINITLSTANTFDDNDTVIGDIAGVVSTVALANTVVEGTTAAVFDADDPTFTSVAGGNTINSVVIYHNATGILLAYIDTATGLPFSTNGGDVVLNFSDGTNKIFAL